MTRSAAVATTAVATMLLVGSTFSAVPALAAEPRVIDVPGSQPTIEAAIDAAQPGDVILVGPGIYPGGYVVPEAKTGITIRGSDRNQVVLDGGYRVHTAIEVQADGVKLENMTAQGFVENGFYWEGVKGFEGRYLTVSNVGLYGIYAVESSDGIIEESYVSGAADAAVYVGECQPCDTTIRRVTATLSAVGYSGTNAGGNLVLEQSIFTLNATGILPNSFDVEVVDPPQRGVTIRGNLVFESGTVPTPRRTPLGGFYGIGIGIAGGVDDVVETNEVTGSTRYGIAVFTTVDRKTNWVPSGNKVSGNTARGSGTADLALAAGSGVDNCFTGNTVTSQDPVGLEGTCSTAGSGSAAVAAALVQPPETLLGGLPEAPAYSDMPQPDAQPSMPAELPAPASAGDALLILVLGVIALVGGILAVYRSRPRDILNPRDRGNFGMRNAGLTGVILGLAGIILGGLLLITAGQSDGGSETGPPASASR